MRKSAISALVRGGQDLLCASSSRGYSSGVKPITATLFPGDGIGPEIAESVKQIFKAAEAPDRMGGAAYWQGGRSSHKQFHYSREFGFGASK
eukprot:jgi/Picre1/31496/NNA_006848.t1